MVGEVTGKFKKYEGTVTLDDNDELQSAGIIVQTGSLDRITKLGMDTWEELCGWIPKIMMNSPSEVAI